MWTSGSNKQNVLVITAKRHSNGVTLCSNLVNSPTLLLLNILKNIFIHVSGRSGNGEKDSIRVCRVAKTQFSLKKSRVYLRAAGVQSVADRKAKTLSREGGKVCLFPCVWVTDGSPAAINVTHTLQHQHLLVWHVAAYCDKTALTCSATPRLVTMTTTTQAANCAVTASPRVI